MFPGVGGGGDHDRRTRQSRRVGHAGYEELLGVLVEVVGGAVEGPAGVGEVELGVVEFEDGAVDCPLVWGHVLDGAEEFPGGLVVRVRGGGGAAEDVHAVGAVALFGVGGGEVDVPAVLEGV